MIKREETEELAVATGGGTEDLVMVGCAGWEEGRVFQDLALFQHYWKVM